MLVLALLALAAALPGDVTRGFDPGRPYVAEIYADAPNADWQDLAYNIAISERPVDSRTVLTLRLAPGGGQASTRAPLSPGAPCNAGWSC